MSTLLIDTQSLDAAGKRKHVLDTLDLVLDQRPKLKLESERISVLNKATASLLSHGSSGLTIEITSLEGYSPDWVGAELSCFFRIFEKPPLDGSHMLTFTSRISSLQRQPNGVVTLVLALPESIDRVQRRRCVRVDVSTDKVPSLKLWPELPAGTPVARKPPLLDSEEFAKDEVRVNNISATGLSLTLAELLMRQGLPQQNKGDRYSLYFTAVSSADSQPAHFWVNAVLRNIIDRPQTSEVCLGFEFVAEGELNDAKRIIWHPLKLDEVAGLGKFIFKWNLDNSRHKPLVES